MQKKFNNIGELMADTKLTTIAPPALIAINEKSANLNVYASYLSILAYGYEPLQNKWVFAFEVGDGRPVSKEDYDVVIKTLPRVYYNYIDPKTKTQVKKPLKNVLEKTPGWKMMTNNGEFSEPVGWSGVGSLASIAALLNGSPISGPSKSTPSACENILNNINPEFTNNIERFCNMIRSRSYLALPAMAYGSLQRMIAKLNGVIKAFQRAINAVYQGAIRIIQQWYSYINGVMRLVNELMLSIIESIIPLDLICLILEAAQILLDDIGFFTSLFSQSGSIFNYLNQFQSYINIASNLVNQAQNPLSTIISYLPPEVKQIIDMVDQIGSDPSGFLSDQLSNYGMAQVADALEGNITSLLIKKLGANHRAIPAIADYLNRYAPEIIDNCSKRPQPLNMTVNAGSDEEPYSDYHLNPLYASYRTIKRTQKEVEKNLKEAFIGIGDSINQVADEADYLIDAPANAVKYMFSSAKTQKQVEESGLGGDPNIIGFTDPDCEKTTEDKDKAAEKVASGESSISRSSAGNS
jgi:hypothetical protein